MEVSGYAIIGAGIGGLTTALAFEKAGVPYQVFEKAPALNEVGAGIWLAPNALKVLNHLGVFEAVKSKGRTMHSASLCRQDLKILTAFSGDDLEGAPPKATIAIHRAVLQQILFEQLPASKIHLGKAFKNYNQLETGKTEIRFDDDSTVETDFIIAADGINSRVRQQLFPESKKRYSGQTCWRGIANYALKDEFANRGLELWGDQIRFGMSDIDQGRVYWFAVANSKANGQDAQAEVQSKLLEMFSDFHPMTNRLISATPLDKIIRNDISDLSHLKHWQQDNICLIGDAAHATTPNMGQGGAQAIEDAYYLNNLILKEGKDRAFQSFEKRRQKKVKGIVNQSWNTGKMAHWKYGKGLRNLLMRNVPKSYIKQQLTSLYAVEEF